MAICFEPTVPPPGNQYPDGGASQGGISRRLGRPEEARRHFEAAERFYRRILDLDAGVNLEEAKALARRNLEFKRDRSAVELARDLSVE